MQELPPGFRVVGAQNPDPMIAPPDPYKQAAERRAQQDQAFQVEDQQFKREDQQIQRDKVELERQRLEREQAELKDGQAKAAGFYNRAASANKDFIASGVGPRGMLGEFAEDIAPSVVNRFDSPERQMAEQAERNFIAAVLRLESGAAISPQEFESQALIYFPQPGDSEEVLAQKARAREQALEQLRIQAGPNFQPETAQGGEEEEAPEFTEEDGLLIGSVSYEGETYDQEKARILAAQWDEMRNRGAGFQVAREGMTFGLLGESSGIGNAIGGILRGDFDVGENYRVGRDAEDILTNQAREELGWAATPIEVAAGGSGVLSRGGQVFNAGRQVAASGQPITRQAVQNQMLRQATRDGAIVGATGGFGYGEGLEGSTVNALAGAALGAGAGYGGQRIGNALSNRTPRRDATELAQAGQAEGVTVNRAMADPNSNNAVTKADASIVGGPRVQRDMQAIEQQIEGRVDDLGRGGAAMLDSATGGVDNLAVGDKVRAAGERFITESGKKAKIKYDRAERLAGDAKVTPKQSAKAVDEMIAKLSETPDTFKQEIAYLQGLKSDLSKDLSVGGLRRMRTALRKKISKGDLVYGEDEARVKEILDVAADDIRAGLNAQGKASAARAFDAADKSYRARMDYIENTVQKLLGKRQSNLSSEAVAKKFQSLASNDARSLRKFYASLSPDEQADVAATFAETLGRNNKDGFTVTQFLRQTTNMSDEQARTLFGAEGAQSIKNLRLLGKEVERVTGAMNSRTSKSGVASYRDWLWSLLATGGGQITGGLTQAAIAGAGVAGATAAKQALSARALMSPKITKWIAQAPKTQGPKAIDAHFNRLGDIAKAEPALAGEIETLRKAILGAANDNAGSLAAENQNTEEGR